MIRVARVGRHGKTFDMWKVRTMVAVGPSGLAGGGALTVQGDARVTPVGQVLRRWRIDELPQLINVARGEMLLVGPRPEAPRFVDLSDDRWEEALGVPPGMAGPTQVLVDDWEARLISSGGDRLYLEKVLPVKLAIDRWYVGNATPGIDLLVGWSLLCKLLGSPSRRLAARCRQQVPEVALVTDG